MIQFNLRWNITCKLIMRQIQRKKTCLFKELSTHKLSVKQILYNHMLAIVMLVSLLFRPCLRLMK